MAIHLRMVPWSGANRDGTSDRIAGAGDPSSFGQCGQLHAGTGGCDQGATTYTAKATDTALGTIRSVEHAIQHLEEVATNLSQNITDGSKRLSDLQVQVQTPFEYAERLASLEQRQQEIEEALDLTKNQASAQLGPDAPKELAAGELDGHSQAEPEQT